MSYSCKSNMADRIKAHNNKILNQETSQSITDSDQEKCNCRQKEECPLNKKCLTTAIVYPATVHYDGKTAKYIGLTEGDFKTRYKNHIKSFKHIKYKTETELSKLVWSLKEKNKLFEINWKILTKATPYQCGSRRCGLCITAKMHFALADNTCIIKRDEFVSRCRHRHKYKLNCVK